MEKIELTDDIKNRISELIDAGHSKRKISNIIGYSTSLIDRALKVNRVREFISDAGYVYVAKCKKSGHIFSDYQNKSGAITEHIEKTYPEYQKPSSYKCRNYFAKTNKYWYEEFVEIIQVLQPAIATKKCNYCEWTTLDLDNKSGAYAVHLKDEHNVDIKTYVSLNPGEREYFSSFMLKNHGFDDKDILSDYVICTICDKKLKTLTNTHLSTHKISLQEYRNKFPEAVCHSDSFIGITSENLRKCQEKIVKKYVSKAERGVGDFIETFGITLKRQDRKLLRGTEIDMVAHDLKIGVEYDGCKYHTEVFGGKHRMFHLTKTTLMQRSGYSLIHIFEDEWETKNDIVKSRIAYIFGIESEFKKIHGRKCTIAIITPKEKNEFLEKNHIQGCDRSSIHIGAFYNNELVAVMTFSNNRNMSRALEDGVYELSRFCTENKTIIHGIATKLLHHFISNKSPKKIISFADRRWTPNGEKNLYISMGFKLSKVLGPDYYYFNNKAHRSARHHKFEFGKNSIKKKFPEIYHPDKTEWQMMQEAGFDRIWDCGKFRYELDLKPKAAPELGNGFS